VNLARGGLDYPVSVTIGKEKSEALDVKGKSKVELGLLGDWQSQYSCPRIIG